jgi:hypothetical protein
MLQRAPWSPDQAVLGDPSATCSGIDFSTTKGINYTDDENFNTRFPIAINFPAIGIVTF